MLMPRRLAATSKPCTGTRPQAASAESTRVETLDRLGGAAVGLLTRAIIEVVRKVARYDDQRFGPAPDAIEQRRHRLGQGIAGNNRNQGKLIQHLCRKGTWTSSERSRVCAESSIPISLALISRSTTG